MFIARWIDNEDVVHIYNGILLSNKKEWNNAICSMDATRNYHTMWSKTERQISFDITFMWNLKYGINKSIYKTETDSDLR